MKKDNSKKVEIRVSAEDAQIIKGVLELEKSNVEAYRIASNSKETEYEKRLEKLTDKLCAL